MCLHKISKLYDTPDETEREAWKIFQKENNLFYFQYKSFNENLNVPLGVWLQAEHTIVYMYSQVSYKSGFHVFTSEQDAIKQMRFDENAAFVKVRVRKLRIEGYEYYSGGSECPVFVFDEMFVPSESLKVFDSDPQTLKP